MSDSFNLRRFVAAQDVHYENACAELRNGVKTSHWMWFIFPQLKGLGASRTAIEFAISGRHEASAYLEHSVLGPRLQYCTELVLAVKGRSIDEIFPYPDDLKFRSCMTLFAQTASGNHAFTNALDRYFSGQPDTRTLELLRSNR